MLPHGRPEIRPRVPFCYLGGMSWSAVVTWLLVGAIAGTLVGMLVKRRKRGYGHLANIGIGLVGALLGGGLVRAFGIDFGLGQIEVSLQDLVSAFLGSLLFLAGVKIYSWVRGGAPPTSPD